MGETVPFIERRVLVLIFALALCVRLLAAWESSATVYFNHPIVDAQTYDQQGESIARGVDPFAGKAYWQPPGYPWFLSISDRLFGHTYGVPRVAQSILGALTCVLVACLGAELFGRAVGIGAGSICALNGMLVYFDGRLLAPSLVIFLQVAAVYAALTAVRRRHPHVVVGLAGVALGLGAVVVATTMVLVPVLAIHARRRAPALLAGFALAIAPVTWHNLRQGDAFLISSNGGINLYLGNNPHYDAMVGIRPGDRWTKLVHEPPLVASGQAMADSRYFTGKVLQWMRADPVGFLRLQAHKLRLFVGGHEVPRNEEIYFGRTYSAVLAALLWQIPGLAFPWGVLFPLAALGLVLSVRRTPVLVGVTMLYSLAVLAFFVTARYRAPLIPWLAIFAAEGVRWLASSASRRRVPALAGVIAIGLVSNVGQGAMAHELNADADFEIGGQLLAEGDTAQALAFCEAAVRTEPANADAWQTLSVVYRKMGRLDDAERAMRKQVELASDNAEAWANLGSLEAERGRLDDAIAHLAHAATLGPLPSERADKALRFAFQDLVCVHVPPRGLCPAKVGADASAIALIERVEKAYGRPAALQTASAALSVADLPTLQPVVRRLIGAND